MLVSLVFPKQAKPFHGFFFSPAERQMLLTGDDYNDLLEQATHAAVLAGQFIAEHQAEEIVVQRKKTPASLPSSLAAASPASQVVTEIDVISQQKILAQLEPTLTVYDLAVLTEESADNGQRFIKDFFWCIDPLDGTLVFSENKPGYSVAISLISRTGVPYIGVVYDPLSKTLYQACRNRGALRNGKPLKSTASKNSGGLTVIYDRSFGRQSYFDEFIAHLAIATGTKIPKIDRSRNGQGYEVDRGVHSPHDHGT